MGSGLLGLGLLPHRSPPTHFEDQQDKIDLENKVKKKLVLDFIFTLRMLRDPA